MASTISKFQPGDFVWVIDPVGQIPKGTYRFHGIYGGLPAFEVGPQIVGVHPAALQFCRKLTAEEASRLAH